MLAEEGEDRKSELDNWKQMEGIEPECEASKRKQKTRKEKENSVEISGETRLTMRKDERREEEKKKKRLKGNEPR
ncbi:hypothetical protein P175DRAFT_0235835 [Aspergillus ochraceoroseus IBT 24754]|uniref:Uncharacterized protein n=1 Tax=Aspergillus ochraceoroseus IBT 24754 TaxID=1392256 RepID=A0A2T5LXA8_9EURO|nr:uncharacterized protein P175DRAFT_0235835 [Aspergillus ochraceoroseus IBT 24754]PTU20873.1 hypothetical protein P175DRAFT_0235835 [Aspergillus ochraceoroseus IBT 24754]